MVDHRQGLLAALADRTVPDASRYGKIIFSESGQLLRFEEKQPGAGAINAGIYLLRDHLVKTFSSARPLSFEKDVFPKLLTEGRLIRSQVTQAAFLDIGTPETIRLAEAFITENEDQFA